MIPKQLTLEGFTSYRKKVVLDFTAFNLACISGPNGSGKSSILDAITFALYGKARKTDDGLINTASKKAEVIFDFEYENQDYRIIRSITRGKGSNVAFFIYNPEPEEGQLDWKVLTERKISDTNAKIERTLRLDYDTFVNASFFLQGKADSFATKGPTERKNILSSILGLSQWDTYLKATRERIAQVKLELQTIDARLADIQAELDQEEAHKALLKSLENDLELATTKSQLLQAKLNEENARHEALNGKRQYVALLRQNLDSAQSKHDITIQRRDENQRQLDNFNEVLSKAPQTERDYQALQETREKLDALNQVYEQFKPMDGKRQELLRQIELKAQSLQQEWQHLMDERQRLEETLIQGKAYQRQFEQIQPQIDHLQKELAGAATIQDDIVELNSKMSALSSENGELKNKMEELKERQNKVGAVEGAQCPFCDQALSAEHRQNLIDKLQDEGESLAQQYRMNRQAFESTKGALDAKKQAQLNRDANQNELTKLKQEETRLSQVLSQIESQKTAFETQRAPRIIALEAEIKNETYLPEARAEIKAIETELTTLGYDTEAHASIRQAEAQARPAETALRELETARSTVEQIKINLAGLEKELEKSEKELVIQKEAHQKAAVELAAEEAALPDLYSLESEYFAQKEAENALQRQLGGARQQLVNLDTQRQRQFEFREKQDVLKGDLAKLHSLETAFGKDGVPAMLIEQALPELEEQANEILHKLSDHTMNVTFSTQREYKSKKREDKMETLDIIISDGASTRDYETFSGGESFRVNFAIRLALSRVLSRRAGARLQTLVIDEGFGNQDARGRQLLIEAINMIQDDFEKILIITHIEELKDQFPNRIEVSKNAEGSSVVELVLA